MVLALISAAGRRRARLLQLPPYEVDFLAGALPSGMTVSRASGASFVDASGNLQVAAVNAPRFTYSPAGAFLGLLREEAKTNFQRNPRCENGVAGSPGTPPSLWGFFSPVPSGLTRTIAFGAANGVSYMDITYAGTLAASTTVNHGFNGTTDAPAASGQTWTVSAYAQVFGSALPSAAWLRVSEAGAAVFSATDLAIPRTASASNIHTSRLAVTRTFTDAATIGASGTVSIVLLPGTVNFTLRIGLPQIERGGMTSVILPPVGSPAASSRAAESISATLGSWFNPAEGTILVEGFVQESAEGGLRRLLQVSGSDAGSYIAIAGSPNVTQARGLVANLGATEADISVARVIGASFKAALAYRTNEVRFAVNGELGAQDSSVTLPAGLTTLHIGADSSAGTTAAANAPIRRITVYKRALSDSQLRAMTAS